MQKFASLSDAIALAEFAHRSQLDKAGLPYIEHPKRVLAKVQAMGCLPYVQIGAILHDVTEDTRFTPEILLELGFSEAAVDIVRLLDRDISSKIFDNLNQARDVGGTVNGKSWYFALGPDARDEFYYSEIAHNSGAYKVKMADIEDNLSPWRISYLSEATQDRLINKYTKAKAMLDSPRPV